MNLCTEITVDRSGNTDKRRRNEQREPCHGDDADDDVAVMLLRKKFVTGPRRRSLAHKNHIESF